MHFHSYLKKHFGCPCWAGQTVGHIKGDLVKLFMVYGCMWLWGSYSVLVISLHEWSQENA